MSTNEKMFNNKIPFSFPLYSDCNCGYNHRSDCDYNLNKGVYVIAHFPHSF